MGIVTTIAPFALALIMLGLGASLTVKDFTRVISKSKRIFCWFNLSISCSSNYWIFIDNYFKNSN